MRIFKLGQEGVIQLIFIILILLGIVAGVFLLQKQGFQIFKSKANAKSVEILDGTCVKSKDGVKSLKCEQFQFKVTSPLEGNN